MAAYSGGTCEHGELECCGREDEAPGRTDGAIWRRETLERLLGVVLAGVPVRDLYEGAGSRLYAACAAADDSEIAAFRRAARSTRGVIADLACGSGRLTLPLAMSGRRVVAVDTSSELLDALMREVSANPPRGEIAPVQADVTCWAPGERFGLITLGATSIMLFSEEQRHALLSRVLEALDEHGRFALTHQEQVCEQAPLFLPLKVRDEQGVLDAIFMELPAWTEHSRLTGYLVLEGSGPFSVTGVHLSEVFRFPAATLITELHDAGFSHVTTEQLPPKSCTPHVSVELIVAER